MSCAIRCEKPTPGSGTFYHRYFLDHAMLVRSKITDAYFAAAQTPKNWTDLFDPIGLASVVESVEWGVRRAVAPSIVAFRGNTRRRAHATRSRLCVEERRCPAGELQSYKLRQKLTGRPVETD